VIEFLWDVWRPHSAVRGRVDVGALDEAVSAYLASRPVEWVDWDDRTP
jgi:hypothetical protein